MTGNGTRRGAFRQGREMTGRGESRSGLFALQTGLTEEPFEKIGVGRS